MANWRRERDTPAVHLTPDSAPGLCGIERERLGPTLWDAGLVAPDLCHACSGKMRSTADLAIDAIQGLASGSALETAKDALKSLTRVVPAGPTRDLVVYARACIVRGDPESANDSLRQWRANMRNLGVFRA